MRILEDRVIPFLLAAAIFSIERTSEVGWDIWAFNERPAEAALVAEAALITYGIFVVYALARPTFAAWAISGSLGGAIFAGRTAGFIEFALRDDQLTTISFSGNILERVLLLGLLLHWHGIQALRAVVRRRQPDLVSES